MADMRIWGLIWWNINFFGRNDAKAETPVLWPPHAKSWLIGKDSDAGRDWGQEERGMTEDEMAGWHHWLDGCESSELRELVMNREAWRAVIHGVAKSRTRLSDWTELNWSRGSESRNQGQCRGQPSLTPGSTPSWRCIIWIPPPHHQSPTSFIFFAYKPSSQTQMAPGTRQKVSASV